MNNGTRALIATAAYVAGLAAICGALYVGYVVALPAALDVVSHPQLETVRSPTPIDVRRAERDASAPLSDRAKDRAHDALAKAQAHEIPKPPPYAAWAKAKAETGAPKQHNARREREQEEIAARPSPPRWSYDPGRVY